MAAITICSDSGAPKNKVWHCFHCFPIYGETMGSIKELQDRAIKLPNLNNKEKVDQKKERESTKPQGLVGPKIKTNLWFALPESREKAGGKSKKNALRNNDWNLPKFGKWHKLTGLSSWVNSSKISSKKFWSQHTTVKLLRAKDKKKNLTRQKTVRGKKISYLQELKQFK